MKPVRSVFALFVLAMLLSASDRASAFSRPDTVFKVFQFPQNQIPRIDGVFNDWEMVPDSFAIGLDQLKDTEAGKGFDLDPRDFDIDVKVGWVKGLNRLYFYIEAYDDSWDFEDPALRQDIFELVVDADVSGGPFIKQENANKAIIPVNELHFRGHGAHAQNYHIFMPVKNKDWAMIWGNTPWIKDFPHANAAYSYDFKHGESGKLKMEFWITPFDYAAVEGIDRSVVSTLKANEIIGLSWCILEFDTDKEKVDAFMNLAHDTRMINNGDYVNAFRLMPLSKAFLPEIAANWSFLEIDRDRRIIQFKDESIGQIEKWHWDFGDGTISSEPNPRHQYQKQGEWTVILTIEGAAGRSVRSKVWDVVTK
jgi:hypothetical protein